MKMKKVVALTMTAVMAAVIAAVAPFSKKRCASTFAKRAGP